MKTRCRARFTLLIPSLAALLVVNLAPPALAVDLVAGDLLVAMQTPGRVLRVDRLTGVQTEVSSGGLLQLPTALRVRAGALAVTDVLTPSIVQIALPGGKQSVLTSGQNLDEPVDLVFEVSGSLLVANLLTPPTFGSNLVRVEVPGGGQTVLSQISMPSRVGGIAVASAAAGGGTFVTDEVNESVSSVDPVSGLLTQISAAGLLVGPIGIAVESAAAGGNLVVADGSGPVLRIDATTGAQTLLASGGNLVRPFGIVVEADGKLVVSDKGTKALVRIDPATGAQTVITTFATQPWGIAVVPGAPPDEIPVLPGAAAAAALLLALAGVLCHLKLRL